MIYFVYGKSSFLVYKKYKELRSSFVSENPEAHLDVFDCDEDCDFGDIQNTLHAGEGLFSQKKCVILKNVFSLNAAKQSDIKDLLEKFIDNNDKVIIVAELLSSKPTGKTFKFFEKNFQAEVCQELDQLKMKSWIVAEIKKRSADGSTISSQALQRFWEMTQGDMWTINSEIDKLINYKEGEISLDDVELLCRGEISIGVFDLVDSIGTKNKARAIELKNKLLAQGLNKFYVFTMIISQFRNLMKVTECVEKGMNNPVQIGRKCSMHPFVVKKTLAQLRGYNKGQLKYIFFLASDADQKTKRGDFDMEEELDYLIARI